MKIKIFFSNSVAYQKLLSLVLIILLSVFFTPVKISGQIFTKLSEPNYTGSSSGSSWIDFNDDGKLDAYVSYFNSSPRLYFQDEDGDFQLSASLGIIPSGSNYSAVAWGDYNNDGLEDIFITSMSNTPVLLKNLGYGNFIKILGNKVTADAATTLSCNWVDYDNDGYLDLFVTASGTGFTSGSGKRNLLYKNNGDETFTKITDNAISTQNTFSSNAGFADMDNDGDQDLFLTEWGKDNWLFENNGDGSFSKISGTEINVNSSISISCSWGDYDNDGYLDLFVGNGSTSNNVKQKSHLFHNNGDKTFTKITTGDIAEFEGCVWTSAWGDVDNDGDIDLYLGTIFDNEEPLFINNGDGTFTFRHEFGVNTTSDGTGITGASFGDYDNDGALDLLTANSQGEGPFIYHNNGNTNNWLNIKCIGTISNRSAIGAKVKVKATINGNSVWQIREIHGVNGFRGSDDLRVHFGLGDATTVDSLIIIWPTGQATIQTNVPVKQFLTITEDVPVDYLKVGFRADKLSGYSPVVVQFNDISISNINQPITSWSWDFNNDGIEDSDEQNPIYTFEAFDNTIDFTITLTVSTGTNTANITRENYINVVPASFENLALNRPATASSAKKPYIMFSAGKAVDGNDATRWASETPDSQWLKLQLDDVYTIGKITLYWKTQFPTQYEIFYSVDDQNWNSLQVIENSDGDYDEITFSPVQTKYIRINMYQCSNSTGYELYEFQVFKPGVTDIEHENNLSENFSLSQNYPNPFNPSTTIKYELPCECKVNLEIFDILGRRVAQLVNEVQSGGSKQSHWNANQLSGGVYFVRLIASSIDGNNTHHSVRKMIFLK